jgi:hypothetical protein
MSVLSPINMRYRLHSSEKRCSLRMAISCTWRAKGIILYIWNRGRLARGDGLLSILGARGHDLLSIQGARRECWLSILGTKSLLNWKSLMSWKCLLNVHDESPFERRLDTTSFH